MVEAKDLKTGTILINKHFMFIIIDVFNDSVKAFRMSSPDGHSRYLSGKWIGVNYVSDPIDEHGYCPKITEAKFATPEEIDIFKQQIIDHWTKTVNDFFSQR